MKFADLENIWTVDLALLSKADCGRVYFERAKRVVSETLSDPEQLEQAMRGRRFQRSYLAKKIGSQRAVTTQNPKIKQLLLDADKKIATLLDQANV